MRLKFGLFAALLAATATHAMAQTRIVTGSVTDSLTGERVTSGQLQIVGTTVSATIKDDGTFTLAAPARDVTVQFRSVGFKRRDVAVTTATNSVVVALQRDYFQLEAIVVTGQATGMERRNLANAVSTVTAEQVTKTSTASIDQALQGKIAGAQISSNNGAPGGGERIRLRGVTSILGENQPLYVVDGVIMSDASIPPGTTAVTRASGSVSAGAQETPVDRIADLNPADIENVEVLKGASASAIYGSKASNGVIVITTKRGRVGAPQFSVSQRFGVPQLSNRIGYREFPDSVSLVAAYPTGGPFWKGANYQGFDHESELYNGHPLSFETDLGVNGGTETTRYFASLLEKHDGGIVTNTYSDKQSLRLNVDQTVGSRVTFSLNSQVVHNGNDRGFTGNDNTGGTSYGMEVNKTPNVIDLHQQADGTWPVNPFPGVSNFLQTATVAKNNESVWRALVAGRGQLSILNGAQQQLKLIASGGADNFTQKNVIESPGFLQYEAVDGRLGTYAITFSQNLNVNVSTNLVHTFKPVSGALTANTSVGAQYETKDLSTSRSIAENLLANVMSITAGTVRTQSEDHQGVRDFGFFGQEEVLTLHDKLMLTAGVRADQSSTNSDTKKLWVYPKAATSYRLTGLPTPFDEVKLRAAFGESGNEPKYGQKFTNLSSFQVDGLGTFAQGLILASPTLHPERQRELEGGFDATLFHSRANLEFTVYQKTITDLLLQAAMAPTTGFTNQRLNAGSLRTRGVEATVNLIPLQTATSSWSTRITFAKSHSIVTSLNGVAAFQSGSYQTGSFWIREGESPTQLWANDTVPGSMAAFLAGGGITLNPHVIGEMTPKFIMGIANDISYHAVKLYGLWDWQDGGMLGAGTWRHNDLSQNAPDHDTIDPVVQNQITSGGGTAAFNQLHSKIGQERVDWYRMVTAVYFKDASFLKLRELSLTYEVPGSLVKRFWSGARYVRLGVSGRNLLQITPYRGGDPEANTFGFNNILPGAIELGAYPPSRSFWFNIDVGF